MPENNPERRTAAKNFNEFMNKQPIFDEEKYDLNLGDVEFEIQEASTKRGITKQKLMNLRLQRSVIPSKRPLKLRASFHVLSKTRYLEHSGIVTLSMRLSSSFLYVWKHSPL